MYENIDSDMGVMMFASDSFMRRTFISAVVNRCITGVKKMNGRLVNLLLLDKAHEMSDDAERIRESIKTLGELDYFMIDEAFRRRKSGGGVNFLSFEVRSGNELCGRLDFHNILDNTLRSTEDMPEKDFFSAFLLLDAQRILEGDPSDQGYFIEAVKRMREKYACMHIYAAIGRAELYLKDKNSTDITELTALAKSTYPDLFAYLDECCGKDSLMRYEISAYSASNMDYAKVFDENGELLENPDYEPWGIDEMITGMIFSSAAVLLRIMGDNIEECAGILKRRSGVFSRRSVRAVLEVDRVRMMISKMMIERYPMINACRYFKQEKQAIGGAV